MTLENRQSNNSKENRFKNFLGVVLTVIVLLAAVHFLLPEKQTFYAEISFRAPANLHINYLQEDIPLKAQCEKVVKAISEGVLRACAECTIDSDRCLENLGARQKLKLSGDKIDVPVLRTPKGVMTFEAAQPELAVEACNETARQTGLHGQCTPPRQWELATVLATAGNLPAVFMSSFSNLGMLTMLAFLSSFMVCSLIIWTQRWHGSYTHDTVKSGPQKFHAFPVPRIGGLAIAASICATLLGLASANLLSAPAVQGFSLLALSAIPAFAGGLAEDITKKVGVLARLLLTMTAGALASVLVGATLTRLDVPGLDKLLEYWPLFAIAFTTFAVGGVANAINIIDGYNGLVGGYSIIVLVALTWVSAQVGDHVVLIASLAMLGAMAGFLVLNWPFGKIFLGDGGAYLLGFWLAELGVLLVVRNPEVSPWFPLAIMIYPVWETLFSMYRRKIVRQHKVGRPDAMHLHQLVYQRLIRRHDHNKKNIASLHRRNSRVAPIVLMPVILLMLPAMLLWHRTDALIGCAVGFCVTYDWIYYRLTHWKAPHRPIRI